MTSSRGGIRENAGIGGKIAGAGTARTAPHRFGLADHGNLLVQLERGISFNVTAILREGDGVQLPLAHSGERRCHHAAMRAAPSLGQKMRSRRENQERHLPDFNSILERGRKVLA